MVFAVWEVSILADTKQLTKLPSFVFSWLIFLWFKDLLSDILNYIFFLGGKQAVLFVIMRVIQTGAEHMYAHIRTQLDNEKTGIHWKSIEMYCNGSEVNPCSELQSVLKLVLLEWSKSKSDGKFGFSMLKYPLVQIFGTIAVTSRVWQHIVNFAWWHVREILRGSPYYNIYYKGNFRQQFPVPKSRNQL